MARGGVSVWGVLLATAVGATLLTAAACTGEPAESIATTTPPATPTTVAAAATASIAATTSTSVVSSTTAPTSSSNPTSTSSSSTTTSVIEVAAAEGEPAQSRPASELPRPTGYARFEPGPPWEGAAALTGMTIGPDGASRPALAVKIDNAPGGRPQWNLADADLVFEENVEGITRFIAVFHSTIPDRIGPVRSARTSDIDVLASLNRPILAWSGGNAGVTSRVRGAHIYGWLSDLSAQSTECFWRSRTRGSPHNLLLDPQCAFDSATLAGPARPVFLHDAGDRLAGTRETRFTVAMEGLEVTWVWDAGSRRYLRRQAGNWHVDADGEAVAAENVVELFIDYRRSAADPRSPEAVTVGYGPAVVHRGGRAITATWAREDRFSMFTLRAEDGTPVALAPGTTFVELAR